MFLAFCFTLFSMHEPTGFSDGAIQVAAMKIIHNSREEDREFLVVPQSLKKDSPISTFK